MAVIHWYDRPNLFQPRGEMEKMQREVNRLFSDFMGRGTSGSRVGVFPLVNVSEDSEKLYVRAELPGIKPEDIEISVEGDTITLRGERKVGEEGEKVSYHRREREAGRFRRILTLASRIDAEGVAASFKNGVLTVALPKAAEAKPKQIKVKSD